MASELRTPRARSYLRRTPIILAIVAFLVVATGVAAFLLINAKTAAAAEQKAKATALAQMGTYTDYSTGVSFQVPLSWEQIPLDDASAVLTGIAVGMDTMPTGFVAFGEGSLVTGGSGLGAVMIFAAQNYTGGVDMSVKEMLELLDTQIESIELPGLSVEGDVRKIEGALMNGAELTAKFGAADETSFMRLCLLEAGNCYYTFMFGADENAWERSRYFFDGTVESFSLVGAQ